MKNKIEINSKILINGVRYVVTENPSFSLWVTCTDEDGNKKQFFRFVVEKHLIKK
jgi:hypothetical protein